MMSTATVAHPITVSVTQEPTSTVATKSAELTTTERTTTYIAKPSNPFKNNRNNKIVCLSKPSEYIYLLQNECF